MNATGWRVGSVLMLAAGFWAGASWLGDDPGPRRMAWGGDFAGSQTRGMGCGPAALLAAVGEFDPDRAARLSTILHRDGWAMRPACSLFDLSERAREAGLEPVGLRVPMTRLAELPLPAVAHLRPGHFVTLWAVEPERVVLSEAHDHRASMSRSEFEGAFSGSVLCLEDET